MTTITSIFVFAVLSASQLALGVYCILGVAVADVLWMLGQVLHVTQFRGYRSSPALRAQVDAVTRAALRHLVSPLVSLLFSVLLYVLVRRLAAPFGLVAVSRVGSVIYLVAFVGRALLLTWGPAPRLPRWAADVQQACDTVVAQWCSEQNGEGARTVSASRASADL